MPQMQSDDVVSILREEKVSGLVSGELSSDKIPRWEDQKVQTKRAGFITP
jgi:hypothetical protein